MSAGKSYDVHQITGYERKHDLYFSLAYEALDSKKLEEQKQNFINSMSKE